MKTFELAMKYLTLGLFVIGTVSCGEEELLSRGDSPLDSPARVLTIELNTPAADGVIFTRAMQEADECAVKTLNLYLFRQIGSGETDNDYRLHATILDQSASELTPTGGGKYAYSYQFNREDVGKRMKVLVIANEKGTGIADASTETGTTLADFKNSLATASVSTGNNADVVVGNGSKGFPMSALAKTSSAEESFVLTEKGADLTAKLLRTVARLDIDNTVPNLTITGVKLNNAIDKSYLCVRTSWTKPEGATNIVLMPTTAWASEFEKGYAYMEGNTVLKHVLYMYEYGKSQMPRPSVEISYILKNGETSQAGNVNVELSNSGATTSFFPMRNYLYTVRLGNSQPINVKVSAKLTVNDWVTGEEIFDYLDPESDADVKE